MLKFFIKGTDEYPPTVGLGLTDANIEMLKQDKPIFFDLKDEGFPLEGKVIIVYDTPQFRKVEEQLRQQQGKGYVFVIKDEVLDRIKSNGIRVVKDIGFLFVYGTTTEALYEQYRGFIGPQTKCVHKGFSPTEKASFQNNN